MSEFSRRTLLKGAGVAGVGLAASGTLSLEAAARPPRTIDKVRVFERGQDGYHSFRPPNVVRAGDGTLLMFASGLVDAGGDFGHHHKVLKRSFDGGRTWGQLQLVAQDPPHKLSGVPVVDHETGRIFSFVMRIGMGGDPADAAPRVFLMHSDDSGATWSDWRERELTADLKDPDMTIFRLGPDNGFQLTTGPHAGRLIVFGSHTFVPVTEDDPGVRGIHTVYSDDHGETWHRGGAIGEYTRPDFIADETCAVERADGSIYINTRNQIGSDTRNRAHTTSSDGGETFDGPYEFADDLVTPIVHCGLTAIPAGRGRPQRLVFTGPTHPTSREQLTVRTSDDGGATWDQGPLIYDGPSSYSSPLYFVDDVDGPVLGIGFETGPRVPPATGLTYRHALDFVRMPIGTLNTPPPRPTITPDLSGNRHHAVVSGRPEPVRGAGGRGRGLELAGHYVEVPFADSVDVGAGPFAIAAWFRTTTPTAQRLMEAYGWGPRPGVKLEIVASAVRATITTDTASVRAQAGQGLPDGQWHHTVVCRDADGTVSVYVDGVLGSSVGGAIGSVSEGHRAGFRFGARLDGIDTFFMGALDELYLFDRALDAGEVTALHGSNAGPAGATVFHLPLDRTTRK